MVVEHSVTEVVLFCVLIIVCLWCDLHAHQADKPVSARNAAIWSCIWVGLALVFAGYIGYSFGSEQVQLFLTGSNGSCPHTVRSPFVPRDHADLRAYLPDHQ